MYNYSAIDTVVLWLTAPASGGDGDDFAPKGYRALYIMSTEPPDMVMYEHDPPYIGGSQTE